MQRGKRMRWVKGDIPARVISRMLYVTLPERGMLPLTKHELMGNGRKGLSSFFAGLTGRDKRTTIISRHVVTPERYWVFVLANRRFLIDSFLTAVIHAPLYFSFILIVLKGPDYHIQYPER